MTFYTRVIPNGLRPPDWSGVLRLRRASRILSVLDSPTRIMVRLRLYASLLCVIMVGFVLPARRAQAQQELPAREGGVRINSSGQVLLVPEGTWTGWWFNTSEDVMSDKRITRLFILEEGERRVGQHLTRFEARCVGESLVVTWYLYTFLTFDETAGVMVRLGTATPKTEVWGVASMEPLSQIVGVAGSSAQQFVEQLLDLSSEQATQGEAAAGTTRLALRVRRGDGSSLTSLFRMEHFRRASTLLPCLAEQ